MTFALYCVFLRAGHDDNGGIEDNVRKKKHKCQEGPNKEQEEEDKEKQERVKQANNCSDTMTRSAVCAMTIVMYTLSSGNAEEVCDKEY